MNKFDQEDKNIIILLIIFLFILSVYSIYLLLNNKSDKENVEVNKYYEEISSTDKFKLYKFTGSGEFNFNIRNNNIKYLNNELSINGINIDRDIRIVNYISFYDYNMVLLITSLVDRHQYVLIFNTYDNTYEVIDKFDDMFIDDIESINISEAGIQLTLTNIINDKLYINESYINPCNYNKDIIINRNKIIFYDYGSDKFNDSEVLEETILNEYKKNMC